VLMRPPAKYSILHLIRAAGKHLGAREITVQSDGSLTGPALTKICAVPAESEG
jgi:hypothetical protein